MIAVSGVNRPGAVCLRSCRTLRCSALRLSTPRCSVLLSCLLTVGSAAVFGSAPAVASPFVDETAAEQLLKDKDLRRVGTTYVLNDEAKLSQLMGQTTKLKRQVVDAGKTLKAAERQATGKQQTLTQLKLQHVELSARLAAARTVEENNRLVGLLNAIAGQIDLGSQDKSVENTLKQARSQANTAQETYVQQVLDMRTLLNSIQDRYALLKADPAVLQALDDLNRSGDKPVELGPSRSLSSLERQLTKIEETVLSEEIVARQGAGNLLYVTAVFNGTETLELAVDTGASSVVLSWDQAAKLGLTPGPDAPRAIFVMADGRQTEGRLVTARSIRVGKFTVDDVECAVLAPENTQVEPLLGQSFLENFIYKIDSGRGVISMTRVEDQPAGRSGSRK